MTQRDESWGWVDMEGDTYNPTHWMHLPAAPTETLD